MPNTVYDRVVQIVHSFKGVADDQEAERVVEKALDICVALKFTTNVDQQGRVNLSEWSVDDVMRLIMVCAHIADQADFVRRKDHPYDD